MRARCLSAQAERVATMQNQAYSDTGLLKTIGRIEQCLGALQPNRAAEIRLRMKIEEALETGYEIAYARKDTDSSNVSNVIPFPGR